MNDQSIRRSIQTARARLDDLQAEIEAGARCAERLHNNAVNAVDNRVEVHLIQAARLGELKRCVRELRMSLAEQRALLRDLRTSINKVRAELRGQSHE